VRLLKVYFFIRIVITKLHALPNPCTPVELVADRACLEQLLFALAELVVSLISWIAFQSTRTFTRVQYTNEPSAISEMILHVLIARDVQWLW
jgi:hypothetical protein